MTDTYVQVQPDSSGKKVDCTTLDNANVRQTVVLGDPSANATVISPVTQYGASVLPVSGLPNLLTVTDKSGTIAAGGSAQVAIAANTSRKSIIIHNPSTATEILQVKFGSGGGYIDLLAGGTLDYSSGNVPAGDIYVVAATTLHAFTAYEGT